MGVLRSLPCGAEEQDLLVRRPAGVKRCWPEPNKAKGTPVSELYTNVKTPFMFMFIFI